MIGINWDYFKVIKREYEYDDESSSSFVLRFFRKKSENAMDPAVDTLLDEIELTQFESYRISKIIRDNIRLIDRIKYRLGMI